jgi:rRNA-processing protein FCF1
LKSEQEVVNQSMLARLRPILTVAGVSVQSMNLNELNYAPEIASGMLKKQQAAALIQARKLIVEGAVRIAQDAVRMLAEGQEAVVMTNDQKVQLISNLLTVTCSDVDATPTVALK